jgi:hypothetical protein
VCSSDLIGSGLTTAVGGEGGNGIFQVVDPPNYPGIWKFSDMFGTTYGQSSGGEYWFAGGGGGGNNNSIANDVAGGIGGGGAGRGEGVNPSGEAGLANTGGGGGGGTYGPGDNPSGAGGSGIVIARAPSDFTFTVAPGTNSTSTTPGGCKVATFTVTGTLTVS